VEAESKMGRKAARNVVSGSDKYVRIGGKGGLILRERAVVGVYGGKI